MQILKRDNEELSSIVSQLHERLLMDGWTVATAESCTGGEIAARLTDMARSSGYFRGGAVVYTDAVKEKVLGVSETILTRYTAVSAATAEAMLEGTLALFDASVGIATTGYAGPGGGTVWEPVGTVYIACGSRKDRRVERFIFAGTRAAVRAEATRQALLLLTRWLEEHKGGLRHG